MKIQISFLINLSIINLCIGEIIQTHSGLIRGKKIKALNNDVYAYLGIPYAKPPIGKLRFREPQPVSVWDNVYNATVMSPICMQDPFFPQLEWVPRNRRYMSEDCLYLNIWVPVQKIDNKPFSTMVWIHGGAFNTGTSNMDVHYGRFLASIGNVIVVTLNYRLGAFGFLNLGNKKVQGNMGMLDQVMALKWINRNIENFGGDRNEITVFGSSVGSVSVSNHILSPLTKGLFKRAILQSGGNYNPSFLVDPSVNVKVSEKFVISIGCVEKEASCAHLQTEIDCFENEKAYTDDDTLSCLQNIPAEKISSAEKLLIEKLNNTLSFVSQWGDPYLSNDPNRDIDNGLMHDVEIMIGIVPDEGAYLLAFYKPEFLIQDDPILTKSEAKSFLKTCFNVSESQLNLLIEKYLGDVSENDYSNIVERTKDALGEGLLTCPTVILAEKYSQYQRSVYYYTFNHARINAGYKKWEGVSHFAETYFVFGMPFMYPENYTPEEEIFSTEIMKLWSSFAKTGKPTYPGIKEEWLPFDMIHRNTMELKLGNIHRYQEKDSKECQLWKEIY